MQWTKESDKDRHPIKKKLSKRIVTNVLKLIWVKFFIFDFGLILILFFSRISSMKQISWTTIRFNWFAFNYYLSLSVIDDEKICKIKTNLI
jgi:hypothetical protein